MTPVERMAVEEFWKAYREQLEAACKVDSFHLGGADPGETCDRMRDSARRHGFRWSVADTPLFRRACEAAGLLHTYEHMADLFDRSGACQCSHCQAREREELEAAGRPTATA